MKKFLLLLIGSLLLTFLAEGQSHIEGVISDKETGLPLNGVAVITDKSGIGTYTNEQGYFRLEISGGQPVEIICSHIGYQAFSMTINPGEVNGKLIIGMESGVEQLSEIEIMGVNVNDLPYRTEATKIRMLEGSNLQDVGDALRSMPSISGVRKGALGIDPVIRGFKYSQLNVQLNGGTRIEGGCPNRMDPATAHVDLNDVKNIKILKGPFALKYGVNFGGVIDISTYNPLFSSKYKTYVNLLLGAQTNHSGFKTKVAVGGTGNIFSYQLNGSWKNYGDYRDGNGNWVPSSLKQQALSGTLAFRIAARHVIYGSVETSHGMDVDFPTLPMDERNDNTNIYSLNYLATKPFGSVNFIRFKAYLSDVHHEMDNKNRPFSDTVVAVSTIDAMNTGGKLGINFNVGNSQIEVGGDLENISKDGERVKNLIMQPMLPRKTEDIWNDAHINNLGFFAEYQRPGTRIDWIAAARLDLNSAISGDLLRTNMMGGEVYSEDETESNYANFSFSGGLTWHLTKTADLLFSLGRSSRSPDITERFIILLPIGYDPYDYLGNPGLLPEINNEADLGIRVLNNRVGTFEVSTFFSYLQNFITGQLVPPSEIKPQTTGVLGVKRFTNIDQAYMTGFEFSYQSPVQYKWEISCNASYTAGWNPEATEYVFNPDGTIEEKVLQNDPLPEIPPLDLYIHASYKFFNHRFIPGVSLRANAAQNRISQAFNERSTPAFAILNLDVKYQFNDFLKIYAGVKNLFDNAYYEHLNRNIIGTSYPLYEPGRIFYANLIINF